MLNPASRWAPRTAGQTKSRVLAVLLGSLLLAAGGCSHEEQAPPEATKELDLSGLKDLPPPGILMAIAKERRRVENARGRTGILAEDSRYSLFLEEVIIRDFFQDRRGGFFVDVGCAWPVQANNTYYLEQHLGWTGIGIDALPDFAPAWEEKRPGSRFFAFLISDHISDKAAFYKSKGLGLSSVSREMASGRYFGAKGQPEEIEVPMTTLNALLDEQGVQSVDLLSMDIEGHEAAALRGFDIDRFQPELVIVEGRDPKVVRFLLKHGYRLIRRYAELDQVNSYFRPKAVRPGP